ncbi:MAG: UrcA family protein [Hyphomonadaceae bacterium]|nr:UrcA family protein [Hyphomonadaceae bacterium]
MKHTAAILAASMLALGAMTGVAAAADKNIPQVRVQIADLKLDRPGDQAELAKRIDRGARQVCRETASRMEAGRCAAETIEHTLALAPAPVRDAYVSASARHESFAVSENR